MNKKFFTWSIFILLVVFFGFFLIFSSRDDALIVSFTATAIIGFWGFIISSIFLYLRGSESKIAPWVFWIVFLGSFYALFNYIKEEHGFGASLGLFILIIIAIGLLYFFVINPIAKHLDKNKNTEDKINELEKRIDEIEKDK
jgi:hypothetical protein